MDFRIVELHKSYSLSIRKNILTFAPVKKVVVMDPTHLDECVLFMTHNEGMLGFVRFRDEKGTHVDEQNCYYDDISLFIRVNPMQLIDGEQFQG